MVFACSLSTRSKSQIWLTFSTLQSRKMSARDVEKLTSFLPYLKKIQKVDFTFNFAHSTITRALSKIAEDHRLKLLIIPGSSGL